MVSGLPKNSRHKFNVRRKMNLMARNSGSMILSTYAGLISAGDQCGSTDAADRSRHEGTRKASSPAGQLVHIRSLNCRFAVTRIVSRHIFNDHPDNIGPLLLRNYGSPCFRCIGRLQGFFLILLLTVLFAGSRFAGLRVLLLGTVSSNSGDIPGRQFFGQFFL